MSLLHILSKIQYSIWYYIVGIWYKKDEEAGGGGYDDIYSLYKKLNNNKN